MCQEISRDPRDLPRAKPEGNLEGRGKSWGRRGWISQYIPSFGGVRIFSSSSIHLQGWIRKSTPMGREGLTVLKSILPCWGWENDIGPQMGSVMIFFFDCKACSLPAACTRYLSQTFPLTHSRNAPLITRPLAGKQSEITSFKEILWPLPFIAGPGDDKDDGGLVK